eukprot:TRINITY_DN65892_c0_g1_i1.p1 TRINITY_DN65892_c0_g1~~TRINITY_DN65892_c0_g1_i1.p1  ORF type:complete len:389 (-),score=33.01 TRINITY_DN65892_c0_g1_i1:81-1151(-)
MTFAARILLVLMNTISLVLMTAMKLSVVGEPEEGILKGAGNMLARSEELAREAHLANSVLSMFLSGPFFLSYLLAFCWYPVSYQLSIFFVRSGILGTSLSGRECERTMEPMEIWLPWDYASHIQLTCCAFFPLLLAEPPGGCATRSLCVALAIWCFVMYFVQRVIHLRSSKETFFTTTGLDKVVLRCWAFPISQLALTAARWYARASELNKLATVFLCASAFLLSCGLYLALLEKAQRDRTNIRRLYATQSEPYRAALARLRYSYFNTNPVQVLMSDCFPELGMKKMTWYEAGKTHLQGEDQKMDSHLEAGRAAAEFAPEPKFSKDIFSRWTYDLQVWFNGAPKDEKYTALGENID